MGLLRNVAGVLLTSAAAVPIGFASSIVVARCLSVTDRGFYALLTYFAVIVYQLTQLGWAEAVIYRTRRHGVSRRTAFSTGLLANGGLAISASLICLAFREPLSHAFLDDVRASAFVLAALAAPLLALGDLLRGVARAIDRFDIQNSYSLLQSSGMLVGLALALPVLGGALDAAIGTYFAVQLALVTFFGIRLAALVGFEPRVDRDEAAASVGYGWNLYVQNLLINLHERVDLFLLAWLGVAAFDIGVYATAAAIVAQLRVLPGAIGIAILPQLAGVTDAEASRLTAAVIRPSALLMVVTAAALAPIGAVTIPLFFGSEYAAAVRPFLLLLPGVAAVAVSRVLARYFAAINRLRGMLVLGATTLVLNVVLNLVLIPRYGIAGAAVASLLSYSAEAIALVAMFLSASGQRLREALFPRASDFTPYWGRFRRMLARD